MADLLEYFSVPLTVAERARRRVIAYAQRCERNMEALAELEGEGTYYVERFHTLSARRASQLAFRAARLAVRRG